jgi:hypothetical protein
MKFAMFANTSFKTQTHTIGNKIDKNAIFSSALRPNLRVFLEQCHSQKTKVNTAPTI